MYFCLIYYTKSIKYIHLSNIQSKFKLVTSLQKKCLLYVLRYGILIYFKT